MNLDELKKDDIIEKIDFRSDIKIELYYDKTKNDGYNIIVNNDMLQYHYLAQEYNIVKSGHILALFYIMNNNIKYYIGCIVVTTPSFDKRIRHRYYGYRFMSNFIGYLKFVEKRKEHFSYLNFARIVLLPNFRGFGLGKHIIEMCTNEIKKIKNLVMIEITSMMFHNYNFAPNIFNNYMIDDLKNILSKEEYYNYFSPAMTNEEYDKYKETKGNISMYGFKGDVDKIGTISFYFNDDFNQDLINFCELMYDSKIDLNKENLISSDIIKKCDNEITPLLLARYGNINDYKFNKETYDFIMSKYKNNDDFVRGII